MTRYALARGVRLVHDPVQQTSALLYPEGVLLLSETAADIVQLCDGTRTTMEIATQLSSAYEGVTAQSVDQCLADLARRRVLATDGNRKPPHLETAGGTGSPIPHDPVPAGLLAELTYRCPLHCTYCANPVELSKYASELTTEDWVRVLSEARGLGVLQVHLSGGEPLLRKDLPEIIRSARGLGMYTNLITSGIPLTEKAFAVLQDAGLDHLQLSIQDIRASEARSIAGVDAHDRKLAVAELARHSGISLTVNVVLHASNIGRLEAIAGLAAKLGADRLELAHTQFYGWAWRNRSFLTPSRAQTEAAAVAVDGVRHRFGDTMEIVYVQPDHHTGNVKPCMNGWGSRQLVIAPNGDVLPCLAAAQLPGMRIPNVGNDSLHSIWYASQAFNRFRGSAWMPEPCQSCALRDVDFGGCRCQAYQFTGDAANTDPACHLSPHHDLIRLPVATQSQTPMYRRWK